ncbi:MAG: FecR family protein, partial [Ferruginibacter sp.]
AKANSVEQVNNDDTVKLVILPDGSKALLEPKSKLAYARNFSPVNREVYLTGEAFFDIKKNVSKPFLVFTNTIITKVLGTSFRVKAWSADQTAIVAVKTGKVSVYKSGTFKNVYAKGPELGGIVVTPNQSIIYNIENKSFNKTLAEKPSLIILSPATSFVFDATPVTKVFKKMEDAYRIPIIYDEETISTCSLSANLGDEPFYDKLNIICKAIGASYEMIDGSIVISSGGCKK